MSAGSSKEPRTSASPAGDVELPVHARHKVELRWTDFDGYGHMHTSAQVIALEIGRTKFVRSVLAPERRVLEWVLVHIEMDFVSELRWEDELCATVAITIESVGRTSLRLIEAIESPKGGVVSQARSVIALWDPEARRTRPLDEQQRAAVEMLGVSL